VHDHAVGIRQHHRRFDIRELLVQRGHLVARTRDHVGAAGTALLQLDPVDEHWLARLGRVQLVVVEAAAPGLRHHVALLLVEAGTDDLENAVGVPMGITQGQCHGILQSDNRQTSAISDDCGRSAAAVAPGETRVMPLHAGPHFATPGVRREPQGEDL
jgi:hypothetical protein